MTAAPIGSISVLDAERREAEVKICNKIDGIYYKISHLQADPDRFSCVGDKLKSLQTDLTSSKLFEHTAARA